MKKDWTEIVRDKLSESAATPPDDLWAGISSGLDAIAPPKKNTVRPVWRWATVAASLAALLVCGLYFLEFDKDINVNSEILAVTTPGATVTFSPQPVDEYSITETHDATSDAYGYNDCITETESQKEVANSPIPTEIAETGSLPTKEYVLENATSLYTDTATVDVIDYEKLLLAQDQDFMTIEPIPGKRKNLSISLYACNTNMPGKSSDENNANINDNYGGPCHSDDNDEEQAKSGTAASRSSEQHSVQDAHHKQPVRFGVSARIPLSNSFSINTGIAYSMLSSDITMTDSRGHNYEIDQALHYIGVPLSIDYNLPSPIPVSFYLTAGAMIEKCIYGRSKTQYSPTTESVREKELQLSMFAGAGIQLNLNKHIALYAEPLATYYFDNHSRITNIYKDRPINIDLRIGLRYTFK